MDSNSVSLSTTQQKKYRKSIYISLTVLVAFLALFAIGSSFKTMSVRASTIKVGVIFGEPSYEDNGYNWQIYQGLIRAENELGVLGSVYTSTSPSQIESQVQHCVQDENDLCIGADWRFLEPISNTAALYIGRKFAVVDATYNNYLSNVRGISFTSEQVGYLAGTLAALMSQSDIIGDLGGMEISSVTAFTEGYRNGAHCANPDITTIISYANTFYDPILGAQFAQGMIAQGADVIFAVAGLTGNGAILTTTQSSKWAIGVDTDQYYSVFQSGIIDGSDHLLSSAMKRTDNGVFDTISDVVSGVFTSGTVIYDLSDNGVGLAPFHETEASVPQSVRSRLNMVKLALMRGMIDPLDPDGACLVIRQQYLPFTRR